MIHFATIPGHDTLKKHLIDIVQRRHVPHAQLFWGGEGNAGLALALAFITYLNCYHQGQEDACGRCSSCNKMKQGVHPDVKFIFPTSATQQSTRENVVSASFMKAWRVFLSQHPYGNAQDWHHHLGNPQKMLSIPREEAREILQTVHLKAFEGAYKVILLWLPEYLHATAANALLKVMEAPPPHTLFVLVSTQHEKVLDTIRSRTQQIYVPPFTDQVLNRVLEEKCQLTSTERAQIVLLAEGNLNRALKLAARDTEIYLDHFKHWMRWCYTHNFTQLVAQAEVFHKMSRTSQRDFLTYAMHMLREALLIRYAVQTGLRNVTLGGGTFIKRWSSTLTHQQISTWIHWLDKAHNFVARNAHAKMLYLNLSLDIARSFRS